MKLKRADEIAKRLGITEETLLGWRDLGMPWTKIGKSIFIFEDSFLSWARNKEITPNAQDAPGQEFFGKSIGEVVPLKTARKSGGN
jgi:hypothetical protein